jgi:hypothetical protein
VDFVALTLMKSTSQTTIVTEIFNQSSTTILVAWYIQLVRSTRLRVTTQKIQLVEIAMQLREKGSLSFSTETW